MLLPIGRKQTFFHAIPLFIRDSCFFAFLFDFFDFFKMWHIPSSLSRGFSFVLKCDCASSGAKWGLILVLVGLGGAEWVKVSLFNRRVLFRELEASDPPFPPIRTFFSFIFSFLIAIISPLLLPYVIPIYLLLRGWVLVPWLGRVRERDRA
jgi:hypothetical protein